MLDLRREFAEFKEEIKAGFAKHDERFIKLESAQEEFHKKEFAAHLLARITLRVVRIGWLGFWALFAYAATNWPKYKAIVDGWMK